MTAMTTNFNYYASSHITEKPSPEGGAKYTAHSQQPPKYLNIQTCTGRAGKAQCPSCLAPLVYISPCLLLDETT